ncbi:peptide deformylase [Mariprofundus erugo]|uniref:Peptide deformylase n=1 Tax=Mariprofundus erugo TaxID=2528639 RepID=A0A5R9GSX0_9PROT|nr:peptide deformylase [Mariprofundus erugo]TLS68165.1 peptide deformylase [Mariprofundus erugo]TLS75757.1 peptide deformylase [Mariprofundus erugo]
MSDVTILVHPHPLLRAVCPDVSEFTPQLEQRFAQLDAMMRAGPGGVGIAAPQIGWQQRMMVVDCRLSQRPCRNHGLLWMCNPVIESATGSSLGREGCLSVPDWVGMVERAKSIRVTYDDMHGQRQQLESSGFEARVIQHELDHLNGILFVDRVVSARDLVRRLAHQP